MLRVIKYLVKIVPPIFPSYHIKQAHLVPFIIDPDWLTEIEADAVIED